MLKGKHQYKDHTTEVENMSLTDDVRIFRTLLKAKKAEFRVIKEKDKMKYFEDAWFYNSAEYPKWIPVAPGEIGYCPKEDKRLVIKKYIR